MSDGGDLPDEILAVELCERFGWTFTELDEQDMGRVLRSISAANLRTALGRVTAYVETHGRAKAAESDFTLWQWAQSMRNDEG